MTHMDRLTAEKICEINTFFYETNAAEFAATRQAPWPGWQRCLEAAELDKDAFLPVQRLGLPGTAPLTVLDVGCGNLRFIKYLREQLSAEVQMECFAVDNCEDILPESEILANEFPFVRFQKLDVLGRTVHEASLPQALEAPRCRIVSCFGLFHHTPGFQYRQMLLGDLVRCCQNGGYVMMSFWQFMDSPDLAEAAREGHGARCEALGINPAYLDEGDFLLGWQQKPDAVRYCHHFTDGEIDALLATLPNRIEVVDRFKADGRTSALNTYVVLKV